MMKVNFRLTNINRALFRRMVVPGTVLALVLGIAGGASTWIWLREEATMAERNRAQGALAALTKDISRLEASSSLVSERADQYGELAESGFMEGQNRLEATKLVKKLSVEAGILRLNYEFMPVERFPVAGHDPLQVTVTSSPMKLEIQALFDRDIYAFIDKLRARMPGHVTIREMEVTRLIEDSAALAQDIARGEKPAAVRADVTLDWTGVEIKEPAPEDRETEI